MRQRGRKSSAALSVVSIGIDTHRPDPPANLTKTQAAIWRSIVGSLPGGWIDVPQEYLMAAYCRHVDAANHISALVEKTTLPDCDLKLLDRLLRMRERESRTSTMLATKMRLTQQARMHPRSAGRALEGNQGGRKLWDRSPPWEDS